MAKSEQVFFLLLTDLAQQDVIKGHVPPHPDAIFTAKLKQVLDNMTGTFWKSVALIDLIYLTTKGEELKKPFRL